VKDDRLARLFELSAVQQQAHLSSLDGKTVEVLVEGKSKGDTGLWSGRSERHEIVHVECAPGTDPRGLVLAATVTRANKHSLIARFDGELPLLRVDESVNVSASVGQAGAEQPGGAGAETTRRVLPVLGATTGS
jgi:hypothetical protein